MSFRIEECRNRQNNTLRLSPSIQSNFIFLIQFLDTRLLQEKFYGFTQKMKHVNVVQFYGHDALQNHFLDILIKQGKFINCVARIKCLLLILVFLEHRHKIRIFCGLLLVLFYINEAVDIRYLVHQVNQNVFEEYFGIHRNHTFQ